MTIQPTTVQPSGSLLLLDGDSSGLHDLGPVLRDLGCGLVRVYDLEAALQVIASLRVALVVVSPPLLSDGSPDLSWLRSLHDWDRALPVILASRDGSASTPYVRAPVSGPVEPAALVQVCREALASGRHPALESAQA
jgi:hypothetical protein